MEIVAAIGAVKASFDLLRTVIDTVRNLQRALPDGDKKDAAVQTLVEADKQFALAEVELAKALGYPLCRCEFPPIPMLKVGWARIPSPNRDGWVDIDAHECPKCLQDDTKGWGVQRQVPSRTGMAGEKNA